MKIVHITPAGGYGRVQIGGAERAVIEMANATVDRGHDVTIVAPDEFFTHIEPNKNIRMIPDVVTPSSTITPQSVWSLARILRDISPDVIVGHLLRGALIGGAARTVGTPRSAMVTVLHSSLQQAFVSGNTPNVKRNVYRAGLRLLHMSNRSRTVAISQSNYSDLIVYDGIPENRIELIPDWVAPIFRPHASNTRAHIRESLGVSRPESKLVLFAGRLEVEKNPLMAVKAISRLDADYVLAVAGAGSLSDELEVLADSLDVPIRMLGLISNIEDYMAAADVLLMTSRYEGFGRVAVEALATGTPVVSTPAAGLLDSLAPFGPPDVQFVHSDAPDAWRDAIVLALASADEPRREELHQMVMNEYGIEKAMDAYLALYEELVNQKGRRAL